MITRRVRHDLDLLLVADPADAAPARGRVIAWEDGRWSVTVPHGAGMLELRGDRWSDSRPVVRALLRAANAPQGAHPECPRMIIPRR